jgi:hypothetical protein
MEQTSQNSLSNKAIANKIIKNIKDILHGGGVNINSINKGILY